MISAGRDAELPPIALVAHVYARLRKVHFATQGWIIGTNAPADALILQRQCVGLVRRVWVSTGAGPLRGLPSGYTLLQYSD
jgi:hypothetical protein